jgi:type II secretion system protein H
MKRPTEQSGRIGGFTLLELIVVMLIMATVLALAGPSLRGFFGSRQLQDTAAHVLALTQYARSQAISEGIIYRLNFSTSQKTYWITAWRRGTFRQLQTEMGRTYTVPKDLILEIDDLGREGQDNFVEFLPDGTATAATIRLIERSGRTLEVACPTVTEFFHVIEREDSYVGSSTQRSS